MNLLAASTVVLVILIAVAAVVVVGLGSMAWGILRGDRELESGGSMGHQMTDRLDDDTRD
jgi:hypothetical protein